MRQVIQLDERQKIQERRTLERRQSMSELGGGRRDSRSDADDRREPPPGTDDRHRGQWGERPESPVPPRPADTDRRERPHRNALRPEPGRR